MMAFLKLIRYKNLLIIALTQYMIRFFIIKPILKINNFDLQFTEVNFLLLVLSTICISAAGYIINDYFDRKTDTLNRPDDVIVDKKIDRRLAMKMHIAFNSVGVLLGLYLSWIVGHLAFVLVQLLAAGILWYYSTTYKRQFFIGNFIVATLTAMVPFLVILYELPLLNEEYRVILIQNKINFNIILWWVVGFSYFAFITTLFREIIKDMEDFEGDYEIGRNSLPVVIGMKYTKWVVVFLILITVVSLLSVWNYYLKGTVTFMYFLVLLIIPMGYLIFKVITAKTKEEFRFASNLSKIIMLAGLSYGLAVNLF